MKTKFKLGKAKQLKGTEDFIMPITMSPRTEASVDEILEMGSKQRFSVKELLYQLAANPEGNIKNILVAAIVLRAIKAFVKKATKAV